MRHSDALLRLRPTNVVTRLPRGSRVCILNPRDLFRALAGRPAIVPQVSLHVPGALPGAVRAARDLDAVLFVTASAEGGPFAREAPATRVAGAFRQLADAAAEAGSGHPLALVGALALDAADSREALAARDEVFKLVDAGLTGLVVLPSNDPADAVASLVAEVVAPLKERELSLEVAVPAGAESGVVGVLAQALRARGAPADVIEVVLDAAATPQDVSKLARAAQPSMLAGRGTIDRRRSSGFAVAGLRRLDVTRTLFDLAARSLPDRWVEEIRAAKEISTALGARSAALAEAVPADRRERIEALAYAEMLDVIRWLGAQGTASAVAKALASAGGY